MSRNFKPMPNVDAGDCEIRAKVGTQWRMVYVANKGDAVSAYVLRVPRKSVKRQRKGHEDIDPAASRYQSIREQGMNQTGTLIRRKQRQCFLDMGLPPDEAAVRALRADLMGRLRLCWWKPEAGRNSRLPGDSASRSRAFPIWCAAKGANSAWTCSLLWPHALGLCSNCRWRKLRPSAYWARITFPDQRRGKRIRKPV